jgi:hypothetical protein
MIRIRTLFHSVDFRYLFKYSDGAVEVSFITVSCFTILEPLEESYRPFDRRHINFGMGRKDTIRWTSCSALGHECFS